MKRLIFLIGFIFLLGFYSNAQINNKEVVLTSDSTTTALFVDGEYAVSSVGDYGGGDLNLDFSSIPTGGWKTEATFSSDTSKIFIWSGYIRYDLSNSTSPNLPVRIRRIKR